MTRPCMRRLCSRSVVMLELPAAGASFVFALGGAGTSLGARRIRLQRAPRSSTLVAHTAGAGSVSCGTLPSGAWSDVELAVHTQSSPHTFDVRINGAATACTGETTEMSAPFSSVSDMDASSAGWGIINHDLFLSNAELRRVIRRSIDSAAV